MATSLLYYNPNVAAHQSNHHLPGVAAFSRFFKIFNPTVVIVDRTGTIKIPFSTTSLFPIPAFRTMQKTFEEICNERAIELLKRADAHNVKLYVFWSGGIDSTLALISLLKQANDGQRSNITVLLNEESIAENPNFYKDHIHGKIRVESSSLFPYLLGGDYILINGEHNDQLFGSDMIAKLIVKFGSSIIHQPYKRDNFFEFFKDGAGDTATTNFYLEIFEKLMNAAPVDIVTHSDYLWWINFSLKWQSVHMRTLSFVAERMVRKIDRVYLETRYAPFYCTDDFQLWSMNNPDKKIKDTWNTYKWPCKDIIYDYTKDADYRDNKIKGGSLHHLLLQQNAYNFIDESMKFYRELDTKEYYNPNNDFI